jgi:hypothetical protein
MGHIPMITNGIPMIVSGSAPAAVVIMRLVLLEER